MVALAPVVADARPAVDDERIDAALREARTDRKPGLSAADDQHRRLAVGVRSRGLAQVEPVRPAEVAGVRLSRRPEAPGVLLVAFQLVQRGEQRPRPGFVGSTWEKSQHAVALAGRRLEPEQRLDALGSGARNVARRRAVRVDAESAGEGVRGMVEQLLDERFRAAPRPDAPREREDVAPMAVCVEEITQARGIARAEGGFEACEPVVRDSSEGLGAGLHG